MHSFFKLAGLALLITTAAAGARAADVENPPTFKASTLLGPQAQGPGYKVAQSVPSNGYVRIYTVQTPWGSDVVRGDHRLQTRFKELAAIDAMEQTSQSKEFGNALVKAGLKPVQFAGKLVTAPVDTVKNTVSGVGNLFNSIGSGIRNMGKTQENAVQSITGAAKQRRLIAYNYGVDPYSQFPPLKQKLDQMSNAAAAGGLVVTGAFIAIPGAAGTVISNVSTAGTLNEMLRDYSAAQLLDMNRKSLLKMGVSSGLVEQLLANPNYTPTDMTAMTGALGGMGKLKNLDALLGLAAQVANRDDAEFMRWRVELMASYQQKMKSITGFIAIAGVPLPMATTRDNGLLGIFPFDALSWTASTSQAITSVTQAARAQGITGPMNLVITGTTTPLAQKQQAKLGWSVQQQAFN
ncbi:MAG: hypothetical protein WCJ41_07645 [Aestuariivirga sp.]|uniref:hypothetical protein n=1 Tax=Aestuariivirga sp. TaxID=2650926 RepID=UPI0030186EB2